MMPGAAAGLSAVVPGSGQVAVGARSRGAAILGAAIFAALLLWWHGQPGAWALIVPFWALQIHDAWRLAQGRFRRTAWLVVALALPVYFVAWSATDVRPAAMVQRFPRVQPFFASLVRPEIAERVRDVVSARAPFNMPCGDVGPPDESPRTDPGVSIEIVPACAALDDTVTVRASGFEPGATADIIWFNSGGDAFPRTRLPVADDGTVRAEVTVPLESVPVRTRVRPPPEPLRNHVEIRVVTQRATWQLTGTMRTILANLGVTVALGFLATVVGALLALPLAALGARNLLPRTVLGNLVYGVSRTFMNVLRSIEPLILAVVFVVWVGLGPFAGMLALTLHTIAALGKLFSESVESIDPGPVEAVRATGASWLQTAVYAVLPQVVSPFTAFTIYRWDINIRMSVIVGFVGGGGIGFILQQWILQSRWSSAATAVVVIALLLVAMDQLSSSVRQRIDDNRPLIGTGTRPIIYVLAVPLLAWAVLDGPIVWRVVAGVVVVIALLDLVVILLKVELPGAASRIPWLRLATAGAILLGISWAWITTGVDLPRLVSDADKAQRIVGQLVSPDLLARDEEEFVAGAQIAVPCDGVPAVAEADSAGPEAAVDDIDVRLDRSCAGSGDEVVVRAGGIPQGASARVQWRMADGGVLRMGRLTLTDGGEGQATVEVRDLVAEIGLEEGLPSGIEVIATRPIGGLQPSVRVIRVMEQLAITLLMALMATTLGALLALPLSMTGARNLMPRTVLGNGAYYASRTIMNLARSVEPLILAAVFAVWVGQGSVFGGVLALTVVTTANLGKLFSESVEDIDEGPLEAIEATGAGALEVIRFGVIPQIVPPFLAFGIYHWDINVRLSTVIGFVGAGGIGFVLREWMNVLRWDWAAVAIIGIVLLVIAMDTLSAKVREALV